MAAANRLAELINNPDSFSGTPGYRFALDQGLQAAQRSGSRMRGSGNVLAELTRLGTGFAQQDYGNEVDRLARINANDQQFQLGSEANRNTATRNANDFTLGTRAADNTRRSNDQNYGLGMFRSSNDFTLGREANANTAQRNFWDFNLGSQRNATDAYTASDTADSRRRRDALDWWNSFNTNGGA